MSIRSSATRLFGAVGLAVGLALSVSPAHAADATVPAHIKSAVAEATRPDADRERDALRKPGESIAFAGIKAGDKVLEIMPGGGYFTRIFSKAVGERGVVYALPPGPRPNAPAGAPDPAAGVKAIAADPGYRNVRVGVLDPGNGKAADEPVDVVWTSLNYHDLARRPDAEVTALNKMAFDALKPGGVYIVIDHASAPGAGKTATQTLHRIDPEAVKKDVTSVGFKFDGESKVLRNEKDPHDWEVHDPNRRGQTDQFMLKFSKPK